MIRTMRNAVLLLLFFTSALRISSNAQSVLLIQGGTLIDGNGEPPLENSTILIEGGRIREIRTAPLNSVPANATVIDATGKFIIPGLQDIHVHYRDWMPPLFINEGITTIHDIGNSPLEWILAQREMFQKEKIVGPRLYAAVLNLVGRRGVTADSDLPNMILFETVEEARKWAQKAVELKADYLKIHEGVTGEMLLAVAQVAKQHGLSIMGHVPPVLDAFQAVELGQTHLEHSTGVGRAITRNLEEVQRLRRQLQQSVAGKTRNSWERFLIDFYDVDPVKEERLIKLIIAKNAFIEPNWVLSARNITPLKKEWAYEDSVFLSRPELSFISKDSRFRWLDYSPWEYFSEDMKSKLLRSYANFQKFVVKLSAAGGKIVVGTGSPDMIPGITVHREMQLMVDAGLPPMKAIQAATKNVAELARKQEDLGTLEAGKYADLLILDANPLETISNTRKIATILKNGKVIDRKYSADFRNPIPTPETGDETGHNSPQPRITAIEPSLAVEGDAETTLKIIGKGLTIGSVVYFNHLPLRTVFRNPELLEVTLPAELLARVGTYPIVVINPEPLPPIENAGRSNPFRFIVKFK